MYSIPRRDLFCLWGSACVSGVRSSTQVVCGEGVRVRVGVCAFFWRVLIVAVDVTIEASVCPTYQHTSSYLSDAHAYLS